MVFPASGATHAGLRSRAIPHFGHAPGKSEPTPGHIGQSYLAGADGCATAPSLEDSCAWPFPPPQQECSSVACVGVAAGVSVFAVPQQSPSLSLEPLWDRKVV